MAWTRPAPVFAALALALAACSGGDDGAVSESSVTTAEATETTVATTRSTAISTTTTTLVTELAVTAPTPTRAALLGAAAEQDLPLDAAVTSAITETVTAWVQTAIVDPTVTGATFQPAAVLTVDATTRLGADLGALVAPAATTSELSAAALAPFDLQIDGINGPDGIAALATATVNVTLSGTTTDGTAVAVTRTGTLTLVPATRPDGTTAWLIDSFALTAQDSAQ
jgi:hypothetical protein